MDKKKKRAFGTTFISLLTLGITLFNLTKKIRRLFKFEAQLAVKSLVSLIILAILFGFILTTVYLSLLGMLFIYFLSLHWSMLLSLGVITLINLFLLIVVGCIIYKTKNHLFFPATRAQLEHLRHLYDRP